MPWLETDVRDQRIQFVMAARRPGANITALCRAFGISRKTGYKWLGRERTAHSVAVLGDRSRRPHHSPTRTCETVTARVITLRETFGWGGAKLACVLDAEGIHLNPRTVDRIIQREGLTHATATHPPAVRRFAHAAPNDLWQMDAKGPYRLQPTGWCHPLSIVDDHSRFAVGLYALPRLDTAGVRAALVRCFEDYGVPRGMLMDHGTPWWGTAGRHGLSLLSVFLLKQGIRLHYGAIRHPQTQGKVERFHRTLGQRVHQHGVPTSLAGFARLFAWFRAEYNEVRPHAALALRPPASCFRPSPRTYCANPPRWEYPSGSDVRRVYRNGCVRYGTHAYFLSEALGGEEVVCLPLAQRILVGYRHMWVGELHPRGRRAVLLMKPVEERWPTTEVAAGLDDVLPMS